LPILGGFDTFLGGFDTLWGKYKVMLFQSSNFAANYYTHEHITSTTKRQTIEEDLLYYHF
jgi:hypothetical protein